MIFQTIREPLSLSLSLSLSISYALEMNKVKSLMLTFGQEQVRLVFHRINT